MAFDEHLKRAFDSLIAELADVARAERDKAATESRTKALEEGRSQGIEDGRKRGVEDGHSQGLEHGRAKGLEEGDTKGLEEGRAKGLEEGHAKGIEEGRTQGWEDGREQGRFEGRQEAEAERARMPVVAPVPVETAVPERVLDGVRAIDRARSLSEILDTLVACAAREASRAAVLLVRGPNLKGWRFIGFDGPLSNGPAVELLTKDSGVIADAIASRESTTSDARPPFAQPGTGGLAIPIEIAGEVVATLYADGTSARGSIELLARHASRALEAVVAIKAARLLTEPALADGNPTADNGSSAADENDPDTAARRFAKLLVSEIKLYHEPAVTAGRRDRDLATRLGGEIARARVMYEQRVPPAVRDRSNYFHDELVRTLANGDPTLLQRT